MVPVRLSGLAGSREMKDTKSRRIQMGGRKGEGCDLSILTGGIGSHTKGISCSVCRRSFLIDSGR